MNWVLIKDIVLSSLDIAIVWWVIYRGLLVLRGTRALRMLLGLVVLVGLYFASYWLNLRAIFWMLDKFSVYLVLAMIVLFQNDIRRALARAGGTLWSGATVDFDVQAVEVLQRASFRLAREGVGALIAIERDGSLNDYMGDGVRLDARLSVELLVSTFQPSSPIHDGAVFVRGNRILAAGCFLPLAGTNEEGDTRRHGTRHRAARGLSEETDALVIVVSEERGTVSVVYRGAVTSVASPEAFRSAIQVITDLSDEDMVPANTSNPDLMKALERAEEKMDEARRRSGAAHPVLVPDEPYDDDESPSEIR